MRQKVPFFGKRELKGRDRGKRSSHGRRRFGAKQIEVVAKVKTAYAEYFLAEKTIEIAKGHLELIRQVNLTAENLIQSHLRHKNSCGPEQHLNLGLAPRLHSIAPSGDNTV